MSSPQQSCCAEIVRFCRPAAEYVTELVSGWQAQRVTETEPPPEHETACVAQAVQAQPTQFCASARAGDSATAVLAASATSATSFPAEDFLARFALDPTARL